MGLKLNLSGLLDRRAPVIFSSRISSFLPWLAPPPPLPPPTPPRPTYMHLRIELLGGGGGGVGPGHVGVGGHVAVAVGRVPAVAAGAPGQGGLEGRQQVVQGPGHDGVVVEGDVEGYDADGKADPCMSVGKKQLIALKEI